MSSNTEIIMEPDIVDKSVRLIISVLSTISRDINQFKSMQNNQQKKREKT